MRRATVDRLFHQIFWLAIAKQRKIPADFLLRPLHQFGTHRHPCLISLKTIEIHSVHCEGRPNLNTATLSPICQGS